MAGSARLELRLPPEKKRVIVEMAEKTGRNYVDVVLAGIEQIPLRDYRHEKEFFLGLHELTMQMQFIGNNINQLMMAVHQIKNGYKLPDGEFSELSRWIERYMVTQDELSRKLERAFFNY